MRLAVSEPCARGAVNEPTTGGSMPSSNNNSTTVGRVPMLQWVGGIGAATAEALAHRERTAVGSARARLAAAAREGLLSRQRPLVAQPALYTLTPAGIRASGLGLQRCRVSAANARHLIVCAGVAAGLERCYPGHRVIGERDLRRHEREPRCSASERTPRRPARRLAAASSRPSADAAGGRAGAARGGGGRAGGQGAAAPGGDLPRVGTLQSGGGRSVPRRPRRRTRASACDR